MSDNELRLTRERLGMTQGVAAAALGTTARTYQRWESLTEPPPLAVIALRGLAPASAATLPPGPPNAPQASASAVVDELFSRLRALERPLPPPPGDRAPHPRPGDGLQYIPINDIDNHNDISSQLLAWRKRFELSQEEAAEAIGIPQWFLVEIEHGQHCPRVVEMAFLQCLADDKASAWVADEEISNDQ